MQVIKTRTREIPGKTRRKRSGGRSRRPIEMTPWPSRRTTFPQTSAS